MAWRPWDHFLVGDAVSAGGNHFAVGGKAQTIGFEHARAASLAVTPRNAFPRGPVPNAEDPSSHGGGHFPVRRNRYRPTAYWPRPVALDVTDHLSGRHFPKVEPLTADGDCDLAVR